MARKRAASTKSSPGAANNTSPPSSKRRRTLPAQSSKGSPAQAAKTDTEKLDDYFQKCDKQGKEPFSVVYASKTPAKGSKKARRSSVATTQPYKLILDGVNYLDADVTVQPAAKWESLKRYRKLTVGSETIDVGQIVLVNHGDTAKPDPASSDVDGADAKKAARLDIARQWKAQVHECRALNENRVFILVSWVDRPEDLPNGPAPYHGKNELIPSNEMHVVDAMTVNGRLDVTHWEENLDDDGMIEEDQYFWRQTYDFPSQTLSALKKICVDDQPYNPDEMIIQCSNPDCRLWLHVKCIAEAAVKRRDFGKNSSSKKKPDHDTNGDTTTDGEVKEVELENAAASAESEDIEAHVFIKPAPIEGAENGKGVESSKIVVVEKNGEKETRRTEQVKCLKCETVID